MCPLEEQQELSKQIEWEEMGPQQDSSRMRPCLQTLMGRRQQSRGS